LVVIVDSKLISYNVSYNPARSLIDVFEVVQNICEDLEYECNDKVSQIIFAFDYEKSDYRLGIWSEYKAGRTYTTMPADFQDNYRHKLPLLAEALGINVMGVSGVEADDLAGILVKGYSGPEDIICLTGDRDWIQLSIEHDNVRIYDPKQLKFLHSEHCGTPEEFLVEKIIKGDSSDNILGLKFCGKVCFEKFLNENRGCKDWKKAFLELANSSPKFVIHDSYIEHGVDTFEALFDFNLDLGRIMDSLKYLSPAQVKEYFAQRLKFKEDNSGTTADIQKLAAEISGSRLGIFGDPLVIPQHQLEFYRRISNG